jgi:membrane associated rhomboid family serine protease
MRVPTYLQDRKAALMHSDHNASPVNPIPPVVLAFAAVIALVEIAFQLGARGLVGGPDAVGWRLAAIERFAFVPAMLDWMLEHGRFPLDFLVRLVAYAFVHASFTHMLFVVVFLLALGKMVAEVFNPWAFLALFFGSAIAAALAYGLLVDTRTPLIGGFPAVYGLIGAFTFLLWVRLTVLGEARWQAFTLIAMLLGIQLIFGLLFGGGMDWVADVAGFSAGFCLSFVLSPGGWARLIDRLRQR